MLEEPGCDGQGAWGALGQETELCWEEEGMCVTERRGIICLFV